jgi:hypothetical protein
MEKAVKYGPLSHRCGRIILSPTGSWGYRFDGSKFLAKSARDTRIEETRGQLNREWKHLARTLEVKFETRKAMCVQ